MATERTYWVFKRATFDAAHHLSRHAGKCRFPHGHTYVLEVGVSGPIKNGMLVDFDELKTFLDGFVRKYDHVDLNDLYTNPTAEVMVQAVMEDLMTDFPTMEAWIARLWEGQGSYVEARYTKLPV